MSNTSTPIPLPPVNLRWGGSRYRDDDVYIQSAIQNLRMLERQSGLSEKSRILDVGCGPARLLTGILNHYGSVPKYVGIDVYQPAIEWLRKELAPSVPFAEFHHIDFPNARYNPKGSVPKIDLSLGEFDCITLVSVFSHMKMDDIRTYLPFLKDHLANSGTIFLTAFVEDDVPPETENPEGYHREWKGALHCLRLNRQMFEREVINAGLQINRFEYRRTNDGQSRYLLGLRSEFSAEVVPS